MTTIKEAHILLTFKMPPHNLRLCSARHRIKCNGLVYEPAMFEFNLSENYGKEDTYELLRIEASRIAMMFLRAKEQKFTPTMRSEIVDASNVGRVIATTDWQIAKAETEHATEAYPVGRIVLTMKRLSAVSA